MEEKRMLSHVYWIPDHHNGSEVPYAMYKNQLELGEISIHWIKQQLMQDMPDIPYEDSREELARRRALRLLLWHNIKTEADRHVFDMIWDLKVLGGIELYGKDDPDIQAFLHAIFSKDEALICEIAEIGADSPLYQKYLEGSTNV